MNGSEEVNDGLNMTSTHLNGNNSAKINNNANSNFNSNSVTQALTNACVIVPTVCFLGTVMAVVLGVTFCKVNKNCDRCACLRMFQDRHEETGLTETRQRFYDRTIWSAQNPPVKSNVDNETEISPFPNNTYTSQGVINPTFENSRQSAQNVASEGIRMSTFSAFRKDSNSNCNSFGDTEFDSSDASRIVNCSKSNASEESLTSSERLYHERIRNFLTDPVLIFHKTYNPDAASVLLNSEPDSASYDRNGLESFDTLNTFREDSSFSDYDIGPVDQSSLFDYHPRSDASKIVNYNESLSFGSSHQIPPVWARNTPADPVHLSRSSGQQASADMAHSCESQSTQESLEATYMRVPPPSPNTEDSIDLAQNEDFMYLNKNPWSSSKKEQDVRAGEECQGSWETARSAESRDQTLEWDNYEPLLACSFYGSRMPSTEAHGISPSERQFWV